jgi:hypothetical protein
MERGAVHPDREIVREQRGFSKLPKPWDGPHAALRQFPSVCLLLDPPLTLAPVLGDLATNGATMRRSLETSRSSGGLGIAYNGC